MCSLNAAWWLKPSRAGRVLDAAAVAMMLGRDRQWVYDHADELGAFRYGDGPRARLGFDVQTVEHWKRSAPPATRRRRGGTRGSAGKSRRGADPVRGLRPRRIAFVRDGSPASGSLKRRSARRWHEGVQLRFRTGGSREHETLHERREVQLRLRRRVDRANGCDRAREHPCSCRKLAYGASVATSCRASTRPQMPDLPRVRIGVACRRRSTGCSATGRSTQNTRERLPMAARPPPPAVLRRVPARRDRRAAVRRLQGAQAARGRRATRGDRRRRRSARRERPTAAAARAGVDPQADRLPGRDP